MNNYNYPPNFYFDGNNLRNYQNNYQNEYGPILLNSDSLNNMPWMWNNKPWPWEN